MARKKADQETKRIVRILEETKNAEYWRDPDRPNGKFVRRDGRVPIDVRRAKARVRTAAWRAEMDRRRAPTSAQIAMSMVMALLNCRRAEFTALDSAIIRRMLHDLHERGFSIPEAKRTLLKLKQRLRASKQTASSAGKDATSTSD